MGTGRVAKARSGRAAPKAERAMGVAPIWFGVYLALAAILGLAFAAAGGLMARHHEVQDARLVRTWADGLAQRVVARVAELRATLEGWGDDPALQRALVTGDRERLEAKRTELRHAFPKALAVSLRTRSEALSPAAQSVDLSFAGHDLIRQAVQSGESTQLEVHRVGQPRRHLAMAGPVRDRDGAAVIGVLYLALPMSVLPDTGAAAQGIARIGYQQRIGESLVTVAGNLQAEQPGHPPDYSIPIPGTRLAVAVWRDRRGSAPAPLLGLLIGAYVLLTLAVGGVLVLLYRRLARSVAADLTGALALIDDAAHARPLRPLAPRLRETARFHEQMLPLLRRLVAAARWGEGGQPAGLAPDGPHRQEKTQSQDAGDESSDDDLAAELEALLAKPQSPVARPRRRDDSAAPVEVFRARDMAGRFGQNLTEVLAREIGQALGSEIRACGGRAASVAHDRGAAAQALAAALGEGLRASGCDLIELGVVPVALLHFACTGQGEGAGVMITSGRAADGDLVIEPILDGHTLLPEQIQRLRERILCEDFVLGEGERRQEDLLPAYGERFEDDIALARTLKLVIDCGHGASAAVAPALFRRLGCQVLELACDAPAEVGESPLRDPSQPPQLAELAERVLAEQADLGLAFDAAGRRLGLIASDGGFIATDQLLMMLAADVLSRQLGADVVCDVACSRQLISEVRRHGGRALPWQPEEASLAVRLRETGALLGGDVRGTVIVAERWLGLADPFYAGARLVELLSLDPRSSAEVFGALPQSRMTPELFLELPGESERILASLIDSAAQLEATEVRADFGLRARYDQGWGLVRRRYGEPGLAFRFEADDDAALDRIQADFRRVLTQISPSLSPPF